MDSTQEARILGRVGETLDQGLSVLVLGWIDSNHSQFTRTLDPQRFLFLEKTPKVVTHRVGYVISTKFVKRPDLDRAKQQKPTHPHVLSVGVIKRILESAVRLQTPVPTPSHHPSEDPVPPALPTPTPSQKPSPSDESLRIPRRAPSDELSKGAREYSFAIAFVKQIDDDSDKALSKFVVSRLLKEHFGDGHLPLRHKDLLEPVTATGAKNAGSYKATARLLELAMETAPDVEPADPIEKARWLAGQETGLRKKKEDLQAKIAEIDHQLSRAAKARAAMEALRQI